MGEEESGKRGEEKSDKKERKKTNNKTKRRNNEVKGEGKKEGFVPSEQSQRIAVESVPRPHKDTVTVGRCFRMIKLRPVLIVLVVLLLIVVIAPSPLRRTRR